MARCECVRPGRPKQNSPGDASNQRALKGRNSILSRPFWACLNSGTARSQGVALGCFVAALQAEQMRMRPSRPTSCEMVAASTKRSENPKGRNPEKRRRGNRVSPNKTPTPVRLSGFRPFGISSSVWQRRSIGAQRRPVIDQPTHPSLCALGVLCGWFPGGTTDGLPKPLRLNSGETSYVATVVDEESKDGERVAPTGHHITAQGNALGTDGPLFSQALKGRNKRLSRPFRGCGVRRTQQTQGVALGCFVVPLRGESHSDEHAAALLLHATATQIHVRRKLRKRRWNAHGGARYGFLVSIRPG